MTQWWQLWNYFATHGNPYASNGFFKARDAPGGCEFGNASFSYYYTDEFQRFDYPRCYPYWNGGAQTQCGVENRVTLAGTVHLRDDRGGGACVTPNPCVRVYVTHLDHVYSEESWAASDTVSDHSSFTRKLVMGDFNATPGEYFNDAIYGYVWMMYPWYASYSEVSPSNAPTSPTWASSPYDKIDYIFYKPGGNISVAFSQTLVPGGSPPYPTWSDHRALLASLNVHD